ncbi:beta strand repeat-containing protein [Gluconobacter oxydans]|uniref:beta strand repeat-containing protein n=1 Tax=Gluconobacter oxydans TaxID=442 RepID=UPI0039E80654
MSENSSNNKNIIDVFQNPSEIGPNIRFNNGEVVNGVEQYQKEIPNLPGDFNEDWDVTQWCSGSYFDPTNPILNSAEFQDDVLGTPIATWQQGSSNDSYGNSSLSIYNSSEASDSSTEGKNLSGYTYAIQVQGGTLNDVNIQSYKNLGLSVTFNHQIDFTANERITNVTGNTGLVSFGNNFTVNFNTVKKISGVPQLGIFMQSVVYDSRGVETVEAGYSSLNGANSGGKVYNPGDLSLLSSLSSSLSNIQYNYNSEVDAFSGETSDFYKVSINLNAALDKIIYVLSKQDPKNASYYQDLSNWVLTGSYVGGESGNLGSAQPSNSSATMDVNNISITQDLSSNIEYSENSQKIQSISGLDMEDNQVSTTTPSDGETNIVLNAGTKNSSNKQQTVTSLGSDSITIGSGTIATIHANGQKTTIVGQGGSATIDGDSNLNVSGIFSSLTSQNNNSGSIYNINASSDSYYSINLGDVNIDINSPTNAKISTGSNAEYNILSKTDGQSIIFTGNNNDTIGNVGSGYQVIVSSNIISTGILTVNGGGDQEIWTGSQDTIFNASDAPAFAGNVFAQNKGDIQSAYVDVQGGTANVNLNTEMVTVWSNAGITNVNGSTSLSANDLLVSQGGNMNITGGAGIQTFVGLQVGADPTSAANVNITAGSGNQTIFNYGINLTVNGGSESTGKQLIISSSSEGSIEYINGGSGYQEIWSSIPNTVINASTSTASGSIKDIIQDGNTIFNSGLEDAQIFVFGGSLDANLGAYSGDVAKGNVDIQGNVTGFSSITLNDFTSVNDKLILTGLSDQYGYTITEKNGSSILTFDNSSSTVVINGVIDIGVNNIGNNAIQVYASS